MEPIVDNTGKPQIIVNTGIAQFLSSTVPLNHSSVYETRRVNKMILTAQL